MDGFLVIVGVLFFLVEALIELAEKLTKEFDWKMVIAFFLGVGGALFFGLDLFEYLGAQPVVDNMWITTSVNSFFVGTLAARYSGELNALLEVLKGFKVEAQRKIEVL